MKSQFPDRPAGIPVRVHFLSGGEPCAICGQLATCALNMGRGAVIACSRCFQTHAPTLFSNLRAQIKDEVKALDGVRQ